MAYTGNTKKTASRTLENMILKASATLLAKSPASLAEFQKILDRSKREITALRGKDSSLKRVYAVETEARYNLLIKVLNTASVTPEELTKVLTTAGDSSLDNEQIRMFMLFRGVDLDKVFTPEEVEIFADLNANDMRKNIYLGVDCSKHDDA